MCSPQGCLKPAVCKKKKKKKKQNLQSAMSYAYIYLFGDSQKLNSKINSCIFLLSEIT